VALLLRGDGTKGCTCVVGIEGKVHKQCDDGYLDVASKSRFWELKLSEGVVEPKQLLKLPFSEPRQIVGPLTMA